MKVLKFGAVWCNSCLVMRPRWEKIEKENKWLEAVYYEFDESEKEIEKFGIDSGKLPVFVFLDKNDNEVERHEGEISVEKIEEIIERLKNK